MSYSATIQYDRPLVRRALNRFMAKRLGTTFLAVLILLAIAFGYLYLAGGWTWPLTLVAAAIALIVAFISWVYYARLRAAEGFFDKATDPTVTFRFTEEGVQTESDLGTSDLRWAVFDEVLKFRDIWLLVYAKSGYMTLPTDQLSPECMRFIEQQIEGTGQKA